MKVLSLTHAHLSPEGLSPVSCERADSIVGAWGGELGWEVDVVHTANTKWPGIWPGGKGLHINIVTEPAPERLMMKSEEAFSPLLKRLLAAKQFGSVAAVTGKRLAKRMRGYLANKGMANTTQLRTAELWGKHLTKLPTLNKHYDFIFVCVGYGDEYLLQTGYTLSEYYKVPMVVDFRDLWSEHHEAGRFTTRQRQLIRRYEQRFLANAALISVPQTHMATLLKKWVTGRVYQLPHSAYVDNAWPEGHVIEKEFTMLYAGKLYPEGPGIRMLLHLIKNMATAKLNKPFKCLFYVDHADRLAEMAAEYGVTNYISANGWISPGMLWKEIRSAHLLLIPDSGVSEDHPVLPTKTFQYAYSGRQILCLFRFMNNEMKEFLEEHRAGAIFTNADEATSWVQQLTFEQTQYAHLPALRKIAMRQDIAIAYGEEVAKTIAKKK